MQPEGRDAASGGRTDHLGAQIIDRLDGIACRLDRLGEAVENLVVLVAAGLTTRPPVQADSDLPLLEDGECPACGGTRIVVPEEPGRRMVRACSACGFSWRCEVDGEIAQSGRAR